MDKSSALSKLATLTAGLKPTGTSTTADLDAARAALASSLLAHAVDPTTAITGLPTAPAASPSSEDLTALKNVLDKAAVAASYTPAPLVFARGLPAVAVGNPALIPAPVSGMLPESIGPFVDSLGALHWFDIFPPVRQTAISRAPSANPFLLLPLAVPAGPIPTTLTVAAGTAWIAAQFLAATAPAGGYVGIAIAGGTLQFSTAATASVSGLQVTATTTLTLTLSPGGNAGPTGGGEPGADGGAVVSNVPAQVTFVFTSSGAEITAADDASLTVYGSTISLKFEATAPVFQPVLGQILVPFAPQSSTFAVESVLSDIFQPSGSAPIIGGAWALPVAVTAAAQLGTAATAGLLLLALDPGLLATFQGSTGGPANLGAVFLECAGGILTLLTGIRGFNQLGFAIELWPNALPNTAHSEIDLTFPNDTLTYYLSSGADHVEILGCGAIISAKIDRPLAADGSRLGPTLPGTFFVLQTKYFDGVLIAGLAPAAPAPPPPIAIALRNALLLTTPPGFILVVGTLSATPAQLDSGGLLLVFGIESLLPILPDPYAANFLPSLRNVQTVQPVAGEASAASPSSLLLAAILWSPTIKPVLVFSDSALTPGSLQVAILDPSTESQPFGDTGQQDAAWQNDLQNILNTTLGSASPQLFLLDVSSNVDQLGVGLAVPGSAVRVLADDPGGGDALSIIGLDLVAPTHGLRVMTVPAVQWEPVATIQNPKVLPYPFPSPAGFLDDGGPTLWGANDVTLVPVAPAPLFSQVIASYDSGKAAGALFTLPFGMAAVVAIPQRPKLAPRSYRRPGLTPVQPSFSTQNMSGGLQMSLTAPVSLVKSDNSPSLPGATVQKRNLVDKSGNPLLNPPTPGGTPLSVLGPAVDEIFNSELRPGAAGALVPLERIDFSGYGASSFSDWTAPDAIPPAVVQVSFKTMVGRTSHEVVQVKSVLYPWGAIVVRTITIDRQDNGEVNRYDSGWIAATPGTFKIPGFSVHPGAVIGAFNIREISDTTQTYKPGGGLEMVGVYFDADIQIDGVLSGGSNGLVPSTGQFGFVQTEPAGTPLTPAQLSALVTSQGSLGGPVNCVVSVGGTAQAMRLTRVEVDNAPHPGASETHEFAAAARGTVVLPQPGNWSVLTRTDSVSEPAPVDPDLGVPLIRQGPAGAAASTLPWRIAEPVDLWTPDSPSMDYCLLHATDTTRILFPRPEIAAGAQAFTSDQTPVLADGFALINSTFLCPRQDTCLAFPNANYSLQISGNGDFTLANVPASFPPSMPRRSLAADSAGAIWFEYSDGASTPNPTQISVAITPGNWSIQLAPTNVRVDMSSFVGIMRTVGAVGASSTSGFSIQNSQFVLGSVLSPLESLFEFLSELGLPNPLDLMFSNSGSQQSFSFKLNAGIVFSLPSPLVPVLTPILQPPDGPWKIGFSMKTGFGNSLSVTSSSTATTITEQWQYYFNLGGSRQTVNMQWAIIPGIPVYVGFLLGFGVTHTFASGSIPASTQLSFQVGGIVSLGGNIIPDLVKAEIALSLSLGLVLSFGATDTITIGLTLTLTVSASIANGLIAISFSASAAGNIIDSDPSLTTFQFSLQASFSVSIDVTVCWLVDISFSESFQYTQALPTVSL